MFRISYLALEPCLSRNIFNQRRVKSKAKNLEALSYEEGLIESKICLGEGKVSEENRIVFRC